MTEQKCGSYHCTMLHRVIHAGTRYERLESLNCGGGGHKSQAQLDRYNSLEYAVELYKKLTRSSSQ